MTSRMIEARLEPLERKPHGLPPEAEQCWARLQATHHSVKRLFDTFNLLRQQGDPRGRISEHQRDLLRAAIVFTAAGVDTCLRTLMRDALASLLAVEGSAHYAFCGYLQNKRLKEPLTKVTREAIKALDPRAALIQLYVDDLGAVSIGASKDLISVRTALGISEQDLPNELLEKHGPFLAARHEVAHEMDLIEAPDTGSNTRRHRDIAAVSSQCSDILALVHDYVRLTAKGLKAARRTREQLPR